MLIKTDVGDEIWLEDTTFRTAFANASGPERREILKLIGQAFRDVGTGCYGHEIQNLACEVDASPVAKEWILDLADRIRGV